MQDFKIVSDAGLSVELADFGARILDVQLPSECGLVSVMCGYDTLEQYVDDTAYVGATIGPVANRIRHGKMTVAGKKMQLPTNQHGHCLHAESLGFNYQTWQVVDQTTSLLSLRLETQDKLFGKLASTATYSVSGTSLRVDYECLSEVTNYLNLTNHAYWNLNTDAQNIKNHTFELLASGVAKKDSEDIPTGEIIPIKSPYRHRANDLTTSSIVPSAVDHHFFSSVQQRKLKLLCIARSPQSGISLLVSGTQTGFQLYSGQFLTPPLTAFSGFCVEPQDAPNAINITQFESPLTTPESPYRHTIVYQLSSG